MKINKELVDKMIKEEFQKMMTKKKLSNRLSQINEELSRMDAEDQALNEVEAGGQTSVSSHAWTGEAGGDKKWKPEFEKKGTHLKEDEMSDEETMGAMGEFEAKFAEIGRAIDAKLAAEAGEENSMEPEASDDDFEEVEVSADEDGESEEAEEETEEIEEGGYQETHQDKKGNVVTADDVQESVEEPIEGESVAQMTDADDVNDNMEKDKHVHESKGQKGSVITESTKTEKKNIFTEGLDAKKKQNLMEELNRMKKFAGLNRDEE